MNRDYKPWYERISQSKFYKIWRAVAYGGMGLTLLVGTLGEPHKDVRGRVLSKSYVPASQAQPSKYSFEIETENGREPIFVEDGYLFSIFPPIGYQTITKEEVDAQIQKGTRVKILVPHKNLEDMVVKASLIRVLK